MTIAKEKQKTEFDARRSLWSIEEQALTDLERMEMARKILLKKQETI
jgi:hypothetical protein